MADDNKGVFFSMAAPNVSRLDVLRAKVRSSQQKVVASSKNIIQSQQREHLSKGYESASAVGEGSTTETISTGPLHKQHDDSSITQLLQEQLRLVYSDRASLKKEVVALQKQYREKEASLQSEVMSFKYKYDVLKKETELYQDENIMDVRDDPPPTHRRLTSSPPKEDYFQNIFGRRDSDDRPPSRNGRPRHPIAGSFDSNSSDSTAVLKLRDVVESYKAKEKKHTNEILFLQMEIQRIQLEQEQKAGRISFESEATPSRDIPNTSGEPIIVLQQQSDDIQVSHTSIQNTEENAQSVASGSEAVDAIMKESLEQTGQELVELQKVIKQLEAKNRNVETMIRKLKDESNTREDKYRSLESRNQELEQKIKELETKDDTRCGELEEMNNVLRVRRREIENQNNHRNKELEKKCKTLEDEKQDLLDMHDKIYIKSNDLSAQNEVLESRIKLLEMKNIATQDEHAQLEDANRDLLQKCKNLTNQLEDLPRMMEKHELTVRITNGTTGRSSEVLVSKSHSLSLYKSLYCNPSIRAARVRTWPTEVAQNVRSKHCKIICAMIDSDGITSQVFDIEELKQVSTSVLFQVSSCTQDKIDMVLRWIPLDDKQLTNSYPLTTKPKGMCVTILNGHSKCSRELYMPLSGSLTVYDTVYNHEGVRTVLRKWPKDVVWRVTNARSRIVCRASNKVNEFAKYSVNDLASLTLRDLYEQSFIDPIKLVLVEEIVVKEDELYLPFKAQGFRQRGWIPMKSKSKMTVRIKNETTQRSRDMLVPISSDLSLFDATYNSDEVLSANVRKWKSKFAKEMKTDLSRLLCVFLGDHEAEIRICSVERLKTITTSEAKQNLSNLDGSVSIMLRCVKSKKGVEAARNEEMRLRIVNHETRRSMFLYVPYSEELSLYDSIYNKPEVRAAQVRMWPKEVLHAIKAKTATIQCHLFDGQASENELQVFSIEKLKETPTKRLFNLIPSSKDVPQLVLKYHSVGNERSEMSLHISNDLTGRFKELEVPVSRNMTLYDIIYQTASVKFSYVRMWPSHIVQKVKNKTAEIFCVMMGKENEITFSIEEMKKTTTTQLVELSPPPYDLIRLVLRYTETGNVAKATNTREIKDIAIRITNHTTGRFRDLIVPLSKDLSLYQSIYNNRSVKTGKVRVWPGNLVQDLKRKVVEVECAVVAANGQIIYTYTVEGMRNTSTNDLFELVPRSQQRIDLLLRCEAKAFTGNACSRLRETFRPKGFRQRGWMPEYSSPSLIRVRVRNEMTNRSVDLLLSALNLSLSVNEAVYENSLLKRRGVRRWPAGVAKGIKEGSSEILCLCLDANGDPIQKLTTQELCETPVKQLLDQSSVCGRIDLSLRYVATRVVVIDVDEDDNSCEIETSLQNITNEVMQTKSVTTAQEPPTEIEFATPHVQFQASLPTEAEIESGEARLETRDLLGSAEGKSNKNLALYPEVLMSLGFNVIQQKAKQQTLAMYPEVHVSLGFKALTPNAINQSLDVYPEGLPSLRVKAARTEMEKQNLGIYSEVISSLGFELTDTIASSNTRMPPNGGSTRAEVETKNLGIYCEVLTCLGFELTQTTASSEISMTQNGVSKKKEAEKQNLGIYFEVLACLGFELTVSSEIGMWHNSDSINEEVPFAKESTGNGELEKKIVMAKNEMTPEGRSNVVKKLPLSFKPTGFRQRGWLPMKSVVSDFRVRLINESSGRWKDLIIPVSDSLTLFDAVYNAESVQRTNIRQFPSQVALEVKQKACEILADVFIPHYGPIGQTTNYFGDTDILIDDEGTAIRSFTVDDLHQTTTVEIFERMSRPKDMVKFVLRVKKVEAVDVLESRVSTLEKQLRIASQQAKSGSELLADKLKALDEATSWNEQLSQELDELRAGANDHRPQSPRSEMVTKSKQQIEMLEQKEKALEQATERNESLKLQVVQLQKEIEILEVAANSSIMPDYKSVVDHVIEEEDDRDELSKDVSFKPVGFRQRGWRSDEEANMEMRLRVTNETTQLSKDFVIAIDDRVTVFDAVYTGGSDEDILDKTSNIHCIVWHDTGKDVRTFSVNALKQMSTKRFFELTSRRQDLMKALIRCQETANNQVQELESEVNSIGLRNEELQNSMCVLSNELAASMAKYNRLQRELDMMKQSQEGGLLFATELFEI